jgi:uncharacterized protein YlxW (UPF0749 family)
MFNCSKDLAPKLSKHYLHLQSKEKEALQEDHEKCQQKIEQLEKSMKYCQHERQASYTKLETTAKVTLHIVMFQWLMDCV